MTEHDRIRRQRAMDADRTNRESLIEAIGGLQSTDDPSLMPLYDQLCNELREMEKKMGCICPSEDCPVHDHSVLGE